MVFALREEGERERELFRTNELSNSKQGSNWSFEMNLGGGGGVDQLPFGLITMVGHVVR